MLAQDQLLHSLEQQQKRSGSMNLAMANIGRTGNGGMNGAGILFLFARKRFFRGESVLFGSVSSQGGKKRAGPRANDNETQ